MDIKQLFKSKDRLSVYNRLTIEEEINIRQAIDKISLLKREALDAQNAAADVEGWSIPPKLHKSLALLHRYHLEANDIPVAGL